MGRKRRKGDRRTDLSSKETPVLPEASRGADPPDPGVVVVTSTDTLSTRRGFLVRAGQLAAGACGLAATAGAVRLAVPDFDDGEGRRFLLGRLADFKMNTLTWVRRRDLFVMRDESGIGAFSAKCTHLGCTVRRSAEGFLCPCHGAAYDPLGEVVKGPAREPLPWFMVWIGQGGELWVDTGEPASSRRPAPLALPGGETG
jgi:cytochrome b6-f complex iron-sulfur subunit